MKKIKTLLFLLSCIAFFTITTVKAQTLLTVEQWEDFLSTSTSGYGESFEVLCTYKYELDYYNYRKYLFDYDEDYTVYVAILYADYGSYTQYDAYIHWTDSMGYGMSAIITDVFDSDDIEISSSYTLDSNNFYCPAFTFIDFDFIQESEGSLLFSDNDDYNDFLSPDMTNDKDEYNVSDYVVTYNFNNEEDSYELSDDDLSRDMDKYVEESVMGETVEKVCFYDNSDGAGTSDVQVGIYYAAQSNIYTVAGYIANAGSPWSFDIDIFDSEYNTYIFETYDLSTGICPQYAYFDGGYNFCFDSSGVSCYKIDSYGFSTYDEDEDLELDIPADYEHSEFLLCEEETLIVFQIAGYAIYVIKILVPLIIVAFTIYELFQIIISGEDKDMKSMSSNLVKRLVAGIIIFFAPTLILLILSIVGGVSDTVGKFDTCNNCLLSPFSDKCTDYVDPMKEN